jgi:hypothetical protein
MISAPFDCDPAEKLEKQSPEIRDGLLQWDDPAKNVGLSVSLIDGLDACTMHPSQ